jgi:energy-coupling factor transporter ATP-binding protein EcfA2
MSRKQDSQAVYSAAQGREFLRGALKEKPNEWIRQFAGLVDDPEVLDLLNYYCGLYSERGDNFLDTHVGRLMLRDAATRMADDAFHEGNVSQLQGMVGLTKSTRDGSEAIVQAARRLADEGAIYLVLGPPGSGKTSFALDILRVWGSLTGGAILSNVAWEGADEITTDSKAMLDGMADRDGPVLQLIDEAGQNLTSRGTDQQVTDQFTKSLKLVRKKEAGDRYAKRGSVLLIGHTRKDTAAEIRRLASGAFIKPSRYDPGKVVFYESDGTADRLEQTDEFEGVTDTREKYDEHEASEFRVVTDDEEDDEGELRTPDDVRRDEAVRTCVRACKPWADDDGMSYADAAALVGYSQSWVGDRVREWTDGKHRHLVAAPEGGSA